MKHSVNKLVVSILVLGALLLSAFTVKAAAANPALKSAALSNVPSQIFEKVSAAFGRDRGLQPSQSAQVKSADNDQNGEKEGSETENGNDDQNETENENVITGTVTTPSPVEFTGKVTAINGNTWTINGKTVLVSDMTKIHGFPKVGTMVRVVGLTETNGSIQARQIIPTNPEGYNGVGPDSSHPGNHSGDQGGSGE